MSSDFTPNVHQLIVNNAEHSRLFDNAPFGNAEAPANPGRHLAVVTCMDARLDPFTMLGIGNGDAHVIRNAGGVITDDVIRSLSLSQRYLGTREIILIHHTQCGVQGIDEAAFADDMEADHGARPAWKVGAFADPFEDVAASIETLTNSPFLQHKDHISGFVYDVVDGLLHAVGPSE